MAKDDFGAFAVRIKRQGANVVRNTSRLKVRAALAAHAAVVVATPVDEGVARSNWLVGVGIPPEQVIKAHLPGHKGSTGAANAAAAIAAAQGVLAAPVPPEVPVYIQNNVPYIVILNEVPGWSPQQPNPRWVERMVVAATAAIKGVKVLGV